MVDLGFLLIYTFLISFSFQLSIQKPARLNFKRYDRGFLLLHSFPSTLIPLLGFATWVYPGNKKYHCQRFYNT